MKHYSYARDKKRKWSTVAIQPDALDCVRRLSIVRQEPAIKIVTDLIKDEWKREVNSRSSAVAIEKFV